MRWFLVLALLLVPLPMLAQTATPMPTPTSIWESVPATQMWEDAQSANDQIITRMPSNITAPNGVPIVPQDNSRLFLGYLKWMLSPASTDEWAGPFAPIFQHVGVGLTMVFILVGVYATTYFVSNAGSWIRYFIEMVRRAGDYLLQAAQAWPVLLIVGIALFLAVTVFGEESVKNWIGDNLKKIVDWGYNALTDIMGRL